MTEGPPIFGGPFRIQANGLWLQRYTLYDNCLKVAGAARIWLRLFPEIGEASAPANSAACFGGFMRLFLIAAVAVSAVALPAAAQTGSGPEITASAGYTRFADGSQDWDGHSATARVAARFHRYFGVEAEGSLGIGSSEIAGIDIRMNHTVAAFAVAYLPLSENFDLTARLGYGSTEFEVEVGGVSGTESFDGLAVGIGGQYFFDESNGLRMDVTRHEYEDLDGGFDAVSFAYVRRF